MMKAAALKSIAAAKGRLSALLGFFRRVRAPLAGLGREMADGDGEDDLFPIAVLIDELKTDDTQVRGAARAPAAERAGPFRMDTARTRLSRDETKKGCSHGAESRRVTKRCRSFDMRMCASEQHYLVYSSDVCVHESEASDLGRASCELVLDVHHYRRDVVHDMLLHDTPRQASA